MKYKFTSHFIIYAELRTAQIYIPQIPHWQQGKLTLGCTTETQVYQQLRGSIPWTPFGCGAYSHQSRICRDVNIGLCPFIRLPCRDTPRTVFTACGLCCNTGALHTVAASTHMCQLVIESLSRSQVQSLLVGLQDSLLERAMLRE